MKTQTTEDKLNFLCTEVVGRFRNDLHQDAIASFALAAAIGESLKSPAPQPNVEDDESSMFLEFLRRLVEGQNWCKMPASLWIVIHSWQIHKHKKKKCNKKWNFAVTIFVQDSSYANNNNDNNILT